jgi:multiple sugar transport system permease protein
MSISSAPGARVGIGGGLIRRIRAARGLGFVAPALIALLLILGLPSVVAVGTSLTTPEAPFSIDNYTRLLGDTQVISSLLLTLSFVGGTLIVHLVIGLAIALALNTQIRARKFWRVVMILPWTIPDVVSGLVWRFMYNPTSGIINHVLRGTGLMEGYTEWLGNSSLAMPSVIFADVWRGYPFVMIILLAGLQSIPTDVREAARVDGAGAFQEFWHVTLPLLKPIIVIAAALDMIWQFRRFGLVYNMTQGGPGRSTEILSLHAYKEYFRFFNYEYASAMAVSLGLIILVLSVPYVRTTLRRSS